MNYYYSASVNAFYDNGLYPVYVEAGNWPEDCVPVENDVFSEFSTGRPPEGKIRIAGNDGLPKWGDIPPMTEDVLIKIATEQKNTFMREAALSISPLQYAFDFGVATPEETLKLKSWKDYMILLSRITTQSGYPKEIQWPESP